MSCEPEIVKSTSPVVSNINSPSIFDLTCNPCGIEDGASPYFGVPSELASISVVTFNLTTDGVLFGVLYPRN